MKKIIVPICGLSLVVIFSIAKDLFYLQLLWMAAGFSLFLLLSRINIKNLQPFWPLFYLISIILLVMVFFEPETRGAHRWLTFFFLRFQPSEIVKPLLIFSFAGLFSSFAKIEFKNIALCSLIFSLPFFLILKQPDLGNALVYLFVFSILILALDFKPYLFVIALFVAAISTPFVWSHLAAYQKARLVSFFTPQYDLHGEGYNSLQALIAVGSGQAAGRGFGQGTQSHLRFLPERHTDFIFSSFVEETGFLGGLLVLIFYLLLFLKIISYLKEVDDHFARFFIIGVFSFIFIQVFVNCGMNLGILPITGITLPLFSYGGSSMISIFASLGIINALRKANLELIAIS